MSLLQDYKDLFTCCLGVRCCQVDPHQTPHDTHTIQAQHPDYDADHNPEHSASELTGSVASNQSGEIITKAYN